MIGISYKTKTCCESNILESVIDMCWIDFPESKTAEKFFFHQTLSRSEQADIIWKKKFVLILIG